MNKVIKLAALLAIFQPTVTFAGEKAHYYDDPLLRNKHYNFKIQKKDHKAVKISKPSKKTDFDVTKFNSFILKKVSVADPNKNNLACCYKEFIGKKIGAKDLETIINNINNHLQKEGLILSFAFAPKQDFANGELKLAVINGRIRDVKVIADTQVDKNKLFNQYVDNILTNYPVKNLDLQKNIQLINRIPGYEVKYNLEPTDNDATFDEVAYLVLIVDKKTADLDVAVNNHGIKTTGKYQFYALGNLYNAFNQNEKFALHIGSSDKSDAMKVATLDVEKFINSYGTSVNLLGSYIEDNPYAVLAGSAHKNTSSMYRASINHYLFLTSKYTLQLLAGFEHRLSKNNTIGSKVSTLKYDNLFIGSNIEFPDFANGKNFVAAHYYHALKNGTSITRYNSSAQNLDRDYKFFTADLYRIQQLSKGFSLFTQVLTQYSNDRLPIEQTFFVGGLTSGRAYKPGLASSNKGIDFNAELRYTKIFDNFVNEVEPYGFYDIVKFSKSSADSNKDTLQSAGFGIRARTKNEITANFEFGFPFTKEVTVGGVKEGNNTRFTFMLSKGFSF